MKDNFVDPIGDYFRNYRDKMYLVLRELRICIDKNETQKEQKLYEKFCDIQSSHINFMYDLSEKIEKSSNNYNDAKIIEQLIEMSVIVKNGADEISKISDRFSLEYILANTDFGLLPKINF